MGWFSEKNGKKRKNITKKKDDPKSFNTIDISSKKKTNSKQVDKSRVNVWGIKKSMIQFIIEVSKDSYPNEFYAKLLQKKGVITEFSIIRTIQGRSHAIPFTYMEPPDIFLQTAGTVHSHPSGSNRPSGADLEFFRKMGETHIIIGFPYTETTWQAYNRSGEPIELKVVRRIR